MVYRQFSLLFRAFRSRLIAIAALTPSMVVLPVHAANGAGEIAFVAQSQTYLGRYSVPDTTLTVEIDGLVYRGTYSANADSPEPPLGNLQSGAWGSAFLFSSSASVLQCQLNQNFPRVSGRCLAADGRRFVLQPTPGR